MAVLPEFKGQGWGSKLLRAVDEDLHLQQMEILWCNAREIAVGFYEKHGFKILGTSFEIDGIGKHYLMYKKPEEESRPKNLSSLIL